MLFENCFIPLIKKPTRFNTNSGSLIDHIWTNVSLDKSICAAIITHPLSDYQCKEKNMLTFYVLHNSSSTNATEKRNPRLYNSTIEKKVSVDVFDQMAKKYTTHSAIYTLYAVKYTIQFMR